VHIGQASMVNTIKIASLTSLMETKKKNDREKIVQQTWKSLRGDTSIYQLNLINKKKLYAKSNVRHNNQNYFPIRIKKLIKIMVAFKLT